jgi:tRNA(Arg) A34 adenosine deaminase TadA
MELRHEDYMREAIRVARTSPTAPFGALLVDSGSGEIVAEGVNQSHLNPVWHGEIDAINRLVDKKPSVDWSQLCLYTTAEPCCMCQGAIMWAGIREMMFGTSVRDLQRMGWKQINIESEEVVRRTPFATCRIIGGVLKLECDRLFYDARRP